MQRSHRARRRNFVQHRFKYTRRAANPETLDEFNGYKTLFGVLGEESRYRFTSDLAGLDALAQELIASPLRLEFVEMYGLDLYQHWHLDNEEGMRETLAATDRFVERLLDGSKRSDYTLVLLSDHGQEAVVGTIPLLQALRNSGVDQADYSYYCELACCRLWFHTDAARDTILEVIRQLPKCTPLHFRDMHQYDICFDDDSFGEYYIMAEPRIHFLSRTISIIRSGICTSDFWVIPNGVDSSIRCIGETTVTYRTILRRRAFSSWQMMRLNPNREQMSLIDFAPTLLRYLGTEIPAHMAGESIAH